MYVIMSVIVMPFLMWLSLSNNHHTQKENLSKDNDNITIELFPSIGPQAQHPYVCALAKATVTGSIK